jgi:hypothetical protein
MAVQNPKTKNDLVTLDGIVDRIPIEFDFRNPDHIRLRIVDNQGNAGDLTQGISEDFTVDVQAQEVIFNDPYTPGSPFQNGYQALVYRFIPSLRQTDFVQLGKFDANVLDDDLDSAVMRDQQIQEDQNRSLKVDIVDSDGDLILPTKLARANTFLSFDSDGDIETQPGPTPRQWNQFFVYIKDVVDVVSYKGAVYRLVTASDTGTEPGTDGAVWENLVEKEAIKYAIVLG